MKKTGILFFAFIGGMLGGFILSELIVRIMLLRQMDSISIAIIGTLPLIFPVCGGIAAVLLLKRLQNKRRED